MADVLTNLENKLDDLYKERLNQLSFGGNVPSWDDYNYRIGYLAAIRETGHLIKQVRNPELPENSGEIPSILDEGYNG